MRYAFLAVFVLLVMKNSAQWTSNLTLNTAVASVQKSQQKVHVTPNGSGGMVACWEDNRNSATGSTDIYGQRMNAGGFPKFAANGIAVCSNTATQVSPAITDVGNGEVIIVWEDLRNGNYDIFAQKLDSLGNALWTADGIGVCTKSTNQKEPKLVSDGNGGAIIVWEDSLNFYWDIYAQRISASGAPLWTPNGIAVCVSPNTQNNPRIDFGLGGGVIITWQDKRNNADYDIYAQSIDASGTPQWAANGALICNAINTQSNPKIEPDGAGGAVIAWEDKRSAADYDIYAQRVNSSGAVQWAANGIAVVNATFNQSAVDMKYVGGNELCLSWKDARSGSYAIYAQMITLSGTALLPANGVLLSSAPKAINPNNIPDGSGGVIVAWQDSIAGEWNITSQKLNAAGQVQWSAGGIVVTNATGDQVDVSQVSDNSGGAIYAWNDRRNTVDYDVYSQKIYSDGSAIVGINESGTDNLNVVCYPNPINTHSVIKVNGLESHGWIVTIYDACGRIIENKTLGGKEEFRINGSAFAKGIYFYTVKINHMAGIVNGKFISTND